MRDMEVAMETISNCRLAASQYRQMATASNGSRIAISLNTYADWLTNNAKEAEKWLVKAGKVYPNRCPA